jgi:hypothetical protein
LGLLVTTVILVVVVVTDEVGAEETMHITVEADMVITEVEWDIMMTIVAVVLMRDEVEVHMMTAVEVDMVEEMGIGGVKALAISKFFYCELDDITFVFLVSQGVMYSDGLLNYHVWIRSPPSHTC